ncbi:OpgC family protein [Lichenihabitans psoromatis]|uniref:OpgC family protein n=1 Tax=Lichenihabitans psoromatis TaxID=2528642 RepID=UPI0010385161|nr:OpgC domain-containing protein [Lichenihabitans psoromatis]
MNDIEPEGMPSQGPRSTQGSGGRRDDIDFWRGFILCTIFINHVPGNLFERFTYRNYGFSDSSEAFVFISGLSLSLAYGSKFLNGGQGLVLVSLARRAVKLYAVHILLSLAGLAIFASGAALAQNSTLMQEHGRDLFIDDPFSALIGLFSLGHQLGYFNILPLYVLMLAMTPAMFWLAKRNRLLMLAASLAVYLLSRVAGLNVPSWPMKGDWFFDPFSWQLMMAVGLAVGLSLRDGAVPRNRLVMLVAGGLVLAAAFCATDGLSFWPGLMDLARERADLGKTTLGAGRIVHFFALAYVVYGIGLAHNMRHAAWFRPLCSIGRSGLWSFAILSVLAAVGQVLTQSLGHSVLLDTLLIGGGLGLLYGCAMLLDGRRDGTIPLLAGLSPRR